MVLTTQFTDRLIRTTQNESISYVGSYAGVANAVWAGMAMVRGFFCPSGLLGKGLCGQDLLSQGITGQGINSQDRIYLSSAKPSVNRLDSDHTVQSLEPKIYRSRETRRLIAISS